MFLILKTINKNNAMRWATTIYNRLKPDGMQMQIVCAHCKKAKVNMKLNHMQYDGYGTNAI